MPAFTQPPEIPREWLREPLIKRVDHNYFHGWVFVTKRGGEIYHRHVSDKPGGWKASHRRAYVSRPPVGRYGKRDARRRAVEARQKGLAELGLL